MSTMKKQRRVYNLFNGEDARLEKNPGVQRAGTPINDMKDSEMPAPVQGIDDGARHR